MSRNSPAGEGSVHLSDLVRLARHDGVRVHEPAVLENAASQQDLLLYRSRRNVQTRQVPLSDGEPVTWRADEIRYQCGALPSGEAVRSLGHWNPVDQVEVFEVLSGRVVILVVFPHDLATVSAATYEPGDVCVLPPGVFHLTYSPWESSTVFNIYNETAHAAAGDSKYLGVAPPGRALVLSADGWSLTPADPEPGTAQLGFTFATPPGSVTEILPGYSDEEMTRFHQDILAAYSLT
ncbi:MAG: cupin domain-containing protein [Jatrophihabitantaceae bacterium]